jgi:hypothetical protein
MKIRPYILLLTLFTLVLVAAPRVRADSEKSKEYQIKAAFIFNFLKFVDWPEEKAADNNEPITIGIIGAKDFSKALEPLAHKKIKNRNISIMYFAGYEKLKKSQEADEHQWNQKMEALKTCHVLVFCTWNSECIANSSQIIKALEGSPVLTIGETDGFLESGGAINFLKEDEKIHFEINNTAAKQAGLKIRSKLLRLATRVLGEETSNGAKK